MRERERERSRPRLQIEQNRANRDRSNLQSSNLRSNNFRSNTPTEHSSRTIAEPSSTSSTYMTTCYILTFAFHWSVHSHLSHPAAGMLLLSTQTNTQRRSKQTHPSRHFPTRPKCASYFLESPSPSRGGDVQVGACRVFRVATRFGISIRVTLMYG